MKSSSERITLYTSNFCGHALSVRRLLERYEVPVEVINVDRDPDARAALIELNGGYASVPTLLFPDGTKLTEPPLRLLKERLGIEEEGWGDRLRDFLS